MNRLFLVLSLLYASTLLAQDDETNKKHDVFVGLGIKYIPIDGLSGGVFELSLRNDDKKLSFNLRQDLQISLGQLPYDSVGYRRYGIVRLSTQSYLEAEYVITRKKNYQLAAHTGYGWIYVGNGKNVTLNRENGYAVITTAISYSRSWYDLEVRGDIPIKANYFAQYNGGVGRTSPVSLALKYRFRPKKSVQDK